MDRECGAGAYLQQELWLHGQESCQLEHSLQPTVLRYAHDHVRSGLQAGTESSKVPEGHSGREFGSLIVRQARKTEQRPGPGPGTRDSVLEIRHSVKGHQRPQLFVTVGLKHSRRQHLQWHARLGTGQGHGHRELAMKL